MKVVVVTGTPGTGKTLIAKKLAKKSKYLYVDVKKLIKNFRLNEKFDKKRKSWIVDINKLNKILIEIIKLSKYEKANGVVFDSHLAHYLPNKYVDLCIVTRTKTKKLFSRLKKRGYSVSKIKENLEAEIMQIILEEARQRKHKIKVIYT